MYRHSRTHGGTTRTQSTRRASILTLVCLLLGLLIASLTPVAPAAAAAPPGQVLAWGDNRSSQLGLGVGAVQRPAPGAVTATTDSGIVAIAASSNHGVAVRADGSVLTWGANNGSGELGQLPPTGRQDPTAVPGLGGVTAVAVGRAHTLALAGGTVYAWGSNAFDQLGAPTSASGCSSGFPCSAAPVQVTGLSGVKAIGAGKSHSLAVLNDGTVRAWGQNGSGGLGDGSTTRRATPVQVKGVGGVGVLGDIVAVTGGEGHTLALAADGTVYAWGQNAQGQLGLGTSDTASHTTPAQVPGLSDIVAVSAGYRYSLALKNDGTVWAWGQNIDGELGNGSLGTGNCACVATPAPVSGLAGVVSIAAGEGHGLAVLQDGAVRAWGANGSGQVGVASPTTVTTPVQVPGLTGAEAVAGGARHSLVLRAIPQFTLQVATDGTGTGSVAPGSGAHPAGAQVTLTPQAIGDSIFVGWTIDGVAAGFAVPLTLTMNDNHTVVATFNTPPAFCDVNRDDLYSEAIRQLSARGVIRGFEREDGALCFAPNDGIKRAQMAALIARPLGWDLEDHGNGFSDRGSVDDNLWRNVGTLAFYNVARGYKPETCAALGVGTPCYGPVDAVAHAQVISFITRGMVAKGYWQYQTDNPALYPNIPDDSGHRIDLATYVHYAGALPGGENTGAAWGVWDQPANRGWFAEVEWRALNSYFGLDRIP
ncbi:MAG TPA: S-layer homology domain-containing protein [Thermomicrobiales bacterium]|jgi:alpha-tubulin suppressor-like RCC1 family protein